MEDQCVHHPALGRPEVGLEGPLGKHRPGRPPLRADTRGTVQSHIGHHPGKHQFTGKGKRIVETGSELTAGRISAG